MRRLTGLINCIHKSTMMFASHSRHPAGVDATMGLSLTKAKVAGNRGILGVGHRHPSKRITNHENNGLISISKTHYPLQLDPLDISTKTSTLKHL